MPLFKHVRMEESKFHFWQRWLTGANIITLLVGVVVAFAGNSVVFSLHNQYTEARFFADTALAGELLQFKNWLFGIIGATIVGFHLLMIMISEYAFKKREPWAFRAIAYGLLSWFIIDSGISLYYGALYNVVMINGVALLLIGLPLLMTYPAFRRV